MQDDLLLTTFTLLLVNSLFFGSLRYFFYQLKHETIFHSLGDEVFLVFELSFFYYQMTKVFNNYGTIYYLFIIIIFLNYINVTNRNAYGSPHKLIGGLFGVGPNLGIRDTILIAITQITAACLAFYIYSTYFGSFLKNLTLPMKTFCDFFPSEGWASNAAYSEALGVFLLEIFSQILFIKNFPYSPEFTAVLQALMSAYLIGKTGGFFNPAIAFGFQYNFCIGFDLMNHFIVYWMGPTLGGIASSLLLKNHTFTGFLGI